MNKLTNVTLDPVRGVLEFTLHTQDEFATGYLTVIYIDEANNYRNIYSEDEELHNYAIHAHDDDVIITFGSAHETATEYEIPVTVTASVIKKMNLSMKHIWMIEKEEDNATNVEGTGIFYDPSFVYDCEMHKLNSYCSTCLSDQQMQRIMLITFKKQILDLAITSGDQINSLKFYDELMRLLDVSLCGQSCKCTQKCTNGMCSIC